MPLRCSAACQRFLLLHASTVLAFNGGPASERGGRRGPGISLRSDYQRHSSALGAILNQGPSALNIDMTKTRALTLGKGGELTLSRFVWDVGSSRAGGCHKMRDDSTSSRRRRYQASMRLRAPPGPGWMSQKLSERSKGKKLRAAGNRPAPSRTARSSRDNN